MATKPPILVGDWIILKSDTAQPAMQVIELLPAGAAHVRYRGEHGSWIYQEVQLVECRAL